MFINVANVQENGPREETASRGSFLNWMKHFLKDGRHFQIVYLSAFLVYGFLALGWTSEWTTFATLFGVSLVTQAIFAKLYKKPMSSLKSALITAIGLCLLFKANSILTLALAAFLSISSKFLIRFKGKHVFNPSLFGIIVCMLLTGDAWVSPGQWGNNVVLLYFFGGAALMVLLKVGRIDTSLAFLAAFGGLQFIRDVLYLGWPMDHFFHQFTNGAILLFAFFMITDPVTTPNARKARILWAACVGVLAFILTDYFYVFTAPIWALFLISPLTVILDRVFLAKKFQWTQS